MGFSAFLVYLYFFTDITGVALVLGKTNILFYGMAFVCVLASAVFNALAWHRLLGSLSIDVGFRHVFGLSWVGIFVDALIPGGWSGDLFNTYLLSKDLKVDGGKAAASIVMKNVLELLLTLGVSVLGLVLIALNYAMEGGILATIGTTMFLLTLPLIIIVYLSINIQGTKKALRAFKRFYSFLRRRPANLDDFEAKIENTLRDYSEGINTFRKQPKSLVQPMIFQALSWFFDILVLFLIFASIGYVVPPDKVIITNTIAIGLQTQGVALAGFAQVISSTVYTILGISPILSVASTLLAGFASFWFKIIIAFFAFQSKVFSRCVPFLCNKCGGFWRRRTCKEKLAPQKPVTTAETN